MKTVYRSYFINDIYLANYLYSELKIKYSHVNMNIFPDFETYFNKSLRRIWSAPYALVCLYSYENDEMIFQTKSTIDFILDKNISNIQIDVFPLARMSQIKEISIQNKILQKRPLIEHLLRNSDLRDNKLLCEKLLERAYHLFMLRHIFVNKSHLNLDEYLNTIFSNIVDYFLVEEGEMLLCAKNNNQREIFRKNHYSTSRSVLHYKYGRDKQSDPIIGLIIENINEIKPKDIRIPLMELGINHHIFIDIDSKYTTGYLEFFSKLKKLSLEERELLRFIEKQLTFVIDNTFFFQELLARKGTEIALFDNTNDGILVVNKNRIVVDINESTERLTGWSRKEAIGAPCYMLYHSCNFVGTSMCNSNECPMLKPLTESKSASKELIYTLDKYGTKRIVKSDYFFNKNVQNETIYGVALVRDLTDRIQLEEKIRHFEQLSTVGKFAAELAHEIRNPITGISCNAQYLYEESNISKSHRSIIKEIVQSANSIEATLQKFLNLAHPPEPNLTNVNLHELILEALSVFRKKMNKMGVKLDLLFDEEIPYVNLDYELIKQVVVNVVLNSLEAMENGGTLRVETNMSKADNSLDKANSEYIRLRICDTGCGIASDNLEKIFDPFFTTKKTGSGLGLYISYKAVKDHGGLIEVHSEEGKGTETIIQFRLDYREK